VVEIYEILICQNAKVNGQHIGDNQGIDGCSTVATTVLLNEQYNSFSKRMGPRIQHNSTLTKHTKRYSDHCILHVAEQ
jgi:hypothetical protein